MLKNMLQMVLGNVNLTEKIQPEIIKFLKNKGTEELLTSVLKTEWEKILDWQAEKLEEKFDKQSIINMLQKNVHKMIRLDKSMYAFTESINRYDSRANHKGYPKRGRKKFVNGYQQKWK